MKGKDKQQSPKYISEKEIAAACPNALSHYFPLITDLDGI
jgi:hypothetical protein